MTTIQSGIRFLIQSCAFLFLFALLAVPVIAQSNKGTIKGTVTDQTGAVVQKASVTATNVATNAVRTVETGDDGTFEIAALEPGTYNVTVTASSFPETVQPNVAVQTSSTVVVDVVLTAGAGTNVVTIAA